MNRKNKVISYLLRPLMVILFMSFYNISYSQKNSLFDTIKVKAFKYLTEYGEVKELKSIKEYEERVYFFELSNPTKSSLDSSGIYGFGVRSSNAKTHILIIDNGDCEILNPDSVASNITECISLLKERNKSEEVIVVYIEAILKLNRINKKRLNQGTIGPPTEHGMPEDNN